MPWQRVCSCLCNSASPGPTSCSCYIPLSLSISVSLPLLFTVSLSLSFCGPLDEPLGLLLFACCRNPERIRGCNLCCMCFKLKIYLPPDPSTLPYLPPPPSPSTSSSPSVCVCVCVLIVSAVECVGKYVNY